MKREAKEDYIFFGVLAVIVIGLLLLLSGCKDSQTSTTTNVYNESNDTQVVIPPVEIISPYGTGDIVDPYIVKEKGLYKTNLDTYYVTSPIDANCTMHINALDNEVFNVVVWDSGYNYIEEVNGSYLVESRDRLNINIDTYIPTYVGISVDCWK